MPGIRFLSVNDVKIIHEKVMAATDQLSTALVRPEGLESAVHSARNLAWNHGADAPAIAVQLAIHIALAHPWVDGNKRTAATAGILFARYNGARPTTQDEALKFGRKLVDYIESGQTDRDAALAGFVSLVERWFS